MGNFKELKVWQKARALAIDIYRITIDSEPLSRDFGLRNQIRKSAISVVSNIAEGDESGTNKQSIRYFHIARGSIAELVTQLDILAEIGYIDKGKILTYIAQYELISVMLHKLVEKRRQSIN